LPSARQVILQYHQDGISRKNLQLMIAKIKSLRREDIAFNMENIHLNYSEMTAFLEMLDRHKKNEPLSKILNNKPFWNNEFYVNGDVLDPRPETELIIEMILSQFDRQSCLNFLDIGTGSGCILLSLLLEYKKSHGVGIDISADAIAIAKHNQKKICVAASFFTVDWRDFECERKFDIIVANPPYIKADDIPKLEENVRNYDPQLALDGGASGLNAYISIIPLLRKWLKPDGSVFFEIGHGQAEDVSQILRSNCFQVDAIKKDLGNIDRIIKSRACHSSDLSFQT
jgi:release factor glutamine methyltransferase